MLFCLLKLLPRFDCVAHRGSGLFCHRVRYLVYTTKGWVVYVILLAYIILLTIFVNFIFNKFTFSLIN